MSPVGPEASPGLRVERGRDGVVRLVLDRPERRNALDDSLMVEGLPGCLGELAADPLVRAVIMTGAGGSFCAGADLECEGLSQPTVADSERYMAFTHRSVQIMREMPCPIIAAVDGPAAGAGLGLALACDIRLASPTAKFVAPFIRLGLPPDFGVSYFLPRVVGTQAALDILLTGRTIGAEEALALGLVSRVEADPLAAAAELAGRIAAAAPGAVTRTKRAVYRGMDCALPSAVNEEIRAAAEALHSEEFKSAYDSWRERILGE